VSAIVGLYNVDGKPIDRGAINRMVDSLIHRGPDGAAVWSDGSIGLGHRMLWTTPESLHEKQPFLNQDGDLAITADARIDNREELIAALGLNGGARCSITDSQLILAAYEKWGEICPEKLLGDFAFVIWDRRNQKMFCTRDHYGIKPFTYYYEPDKAFVFGSEIKAVLSVPGVPCCLNELMVGYHLNLNYQDKAATFYKGIYRLPPAHCLSISPDGIRTWAYWAFNPERELRLGSDDEYSEAYREVFDEAVRCRLRKAYPIGSQLSGGLDSSSVTCLARQLLSEDGNSPLHTVSLVYDIVTECDESSFINEVLAQGGYESHFVHPDEISPLDDMDRVLSHVDMPYGSPTIYLAWAMASTARDSGIRIMLDGLDGDTAVGHGEAYLSELASGGYWSNFAEEAEYLSDIRYKRNVKSEALAYYGYPHLIGLAQSGKWLEFARQTSDVARNFGVTKRSVFVNQGLKPIVPSPVYRAWWAIKGHRKPATIEIDPIIKPSFAKRVDLNNRVEKPRSGSVMTAREEHYRNLTSGLLTWVFEITDSVSAAFSIESRHPFADRRLLEFCLALPAHQKLSHGWTRVVLRRALAGVLPEKIQWRGGKTLNSPTFTYSFLKHDKARLDEVILKDPSVIEDYVNVNFLRKAYSQYLSDNSRRVDEMRIWTVVTFALWLKKTGLTP
jgi:asparagine synthase (glutamine-hydrolysing)